MCCQNSKLAPWEVARRVLRQNRLWEPSDRTMLDFRHGGAMSREGVTHRALHPESIGAHGGAKFRCTVRRGANR